MHFESQGMSLSYGTLDYPVPGEVVQADQEITFTIAVQPIDASNKIEVLYRVNQGVTKAAVAKWLRNHAASKSQYFKACLPAFAAGDTVEYTVICHCAGRQVPSEEEAQQFHSSFRVMEADGSLPESGLAPSANRNTVRASQQFAQLTVPSPSPLLEKTEMVGGRSRINNNQLNAVQFQPQLFIITGNIEFSGNDLLEGRVEAYDRDLPSLEQRGAAPQLLGQSPIDANFSFRIEFTDEQFRRGEGKTVSLLKRPSKIAPDLTFRVFDTSGQELKIVRIVTSNREYSPEQILFNAPPTLEGLTLVIEPAPAVGDSEYEQLVALIAPVLEDLPIAELTNDDILFLVNELELQQSPEKQNQIRWLRYSALLARETNLPIEAFYGWGRKNLPALLTEIANVSPTSLPSVLNKLIGLETKQLNKALMDAIEDFIIPISLGSQVGTIVQQLQRRNQVLRQVTAQLKDAETDQALAGYTVTTFDRTAGEENLGLDITDNEGKFFFSFYVPSDLPKDAPARKFAFKVQTLTGEEIPESEPVDISPNQPETDIVSVSVKVPKPPTPELQEQLQQVQIAPPELLTYFSDQGIKTFTDIRLKGGINRLPDLPQIDSDTKNKLVALVDLDRLELKVTASTALIEKQYDSVLAIADAPRSEFVSAVKDTHEDLTELEATKLHIMASAQTDFLNNLLVEMATNQANGFTL